MLSKETVFNQITMTVSALSGADFKDEWAITSVHGLQTT